MDDVRVDLVDPPEDSKERGMKQVERNLII